MLGSQTDHLASRLPYSWETYFLPLPLLGEGAGGCAGGGGGGL